MKLVLLVLFSLCSAAKAAYCEYEPHLVYGVVEPNECKYISSDVLEKLDPVLEQYATEVMKGCACGFIYGTRMSIDEAISLHRDKYMDAVDIFAQKYNFGKPQLLLALNGDYEPSRNCESYDPSNVEEPGSSEEQSQEIEDDQEPGAVDLLVVNATDMKSNQFETKSTQVKWNQLPFNRAASCSIFGNWAKFPTRIQLQHWPRYAANPASKQGTSPAVIRSRFQARPLRLRWIAGSSISLRFLKA
jgi:hypothetical protein